MIDLHSHILPALDDGARDIGESLAIARAAAREGTTVIAATPHVRSDYPTRLEDILDGVEALNSVLSVEQLPVVVVPGAEIGLDLLRPMSPADAARYGLAGNPKFVLVEVPYRGWPDDLVDEVLRLKRGGITVVLAHPERNDAVQRDISHVEHAVAAGAIVQVTVGSLAGDAGRGSRLAARRLLERRLCHMLASDAHGPGLRRASLGTARRFLADEDAFRVLTEEVPRTILDRRGLPRLPTPPATGLGGSGSR